ncbi:hypothetical protein QFC22_005726 [Naganishia vaughanmartiniae]|uniref:Uncharacterized protein n=1 Tax=Naganishia vaughanmartiniae TaxID=1424756 RepID=A0ACC2WSY7_9TREE|nr:hypothetical protein QFC22_005726 [Naganishia vaughanmartiniae]
MSTEEELPPSKLGTKEYWDKVYEREVGVFQDTGDEGEVWFGERAMVKMRDWVYTNCPPVQQGRRIRVMECGCGNATLLLSLLTPPANDDDEEEDDIHPSASANRFYPNQLTGIDYSEASIRLAQGVAQQRKDKWRRKVEKAKKAAVHDENGDEQQGGDTQQDEESESSEEDDEEYDSDDEDTLSPASLELDDPLLTTSPLFITGDLLTFRNICDLYSNLPESHDQVSQSDMDEPWDLVMDKGTFDALALSQDTVSMPSQDENGEEKMVQRLPSAVYPEKVAQLVKKGGYFLITCTSERGCGIARDTVSCAKVVFSIACNFTEQEIKSRFGKPELGK